MQGHDIQTPEVKRRTKNNYQEASTTQMEQYSTRLNKHKKRKEKQI